MIKRREVISRRGRGESRCDSREGIDRIRKFRRGRRTKADPRRPVSRGVKEGGVVVVVVMVVVVAAHDTQLIAYRIGSESPGREIGAITRREIVTLGNLRVSGRASGRHAARRTRRSPGALACARVRVHHNNSLVIFIWSRFIARDGLWAAGTVCY